MSRKCLLRNHELVLSVYELVRLGLFFFSSRRRHTRSLCDWSSDVCSSDLERAHGTVNVVAAAAAAGVRRYVHMSALGAREGARSRYHQTKWAAEEAVRVCPLPWTIFRPRSEERRVGKEGRARRRAEE